MPEKIVKKTNFVGLFLLYLIKVQDFIDAVDADDEFQYEILEVPGGILVAYRG